MFVCIHTKDQIDHANELTDEIFERDWPLYELECINRGGDWVPYKGDVPFQFDNVSI